MAEEESAKEEVKEAPAAPAKAPSAWPPIIAVLILMPVISVAVTQFVLIPRIKAAVSQQGGASKAETPAPEHKEKPKDKKSEGKPPPTYEFSNIVVNLSGSGGTRYLKTSFTITGSKADLAQILN